MKTPHTELSISGDGAQEVINWIKRKFALTIIGENSEDSVPVEETDFWKQMQTNRVGNLIEGYRLKAGMKQAELAEKIGIKQNMVSEYESGKRNLTVAMRKRFADALKVDAGRLR